MKISDLQDSYPLIYAAAVKNRGESDWIRATENDLEEAFGWAETPEGDRFWDRINDGRFDAAKELQPELFAPLKKYPLGPIKLKLDHIGQITNYDSDIPKHLRKHGQLSALNCTFEIVAYHNDLYIVKVIHKDGTVITQLGYKENMLEPLKAVPVRDYWCVENAPNFTKSMFDAMVNYCEKKYGPYKRRDVLLSWENFVNGRYSCFWVASDRIGTEYVYSQDNNTQSISLITLDEMLQIIDYKVPKPIPKQSKEEWDEEVVEWDEEPWPNDEHDKPVGIVIPSFQLVPSKANFTLRKVPTLRVQTKKEQLKQISIIIKSNHVKS